MNDYRKFVWRYIIASVKCQMLYIWFASLITRQSSVMHKIYLRRNAKREVRKTKRFDGFPFYQTRIPHHASLSPDVKISTNEIINHAYGIRNSIWENMIGNNYEKKYKTILISIIVDPIDRSVDRPNNFSLLSRPNATSRARVTTCLRSNPAAIGKYRVVSMRHTCRWRTDCLVICRETP